MKFSTGFGLVLLGVILFWGATTNLPILGFLGIFLAIIGVCALVLGILVMIVRVIPILLLFVNIDFR
jgi:hypothetical protein